MIEYHLVNETIEYAPHIVMDEQEKVFVIQRSVDETILIPVTSVVKIIENHNHDDN